MSALDPVAIREAKAEAAVAAAAPSELEPSFPYTRLPFDPTLFTLAAAQPANPKAV